jgi:hypothetical protein
MTTHPDPEQLSAYIDGELTGAERDDLEQHLTSCSECSATVRAIRGTVADLRALPTPAPSETDSWRVRAAIAKARRRPAARYRAWVAGAGVAAAVIALAVVTIGRTTSSTFGSTGSHVNGAAGVGGGAPVQPSVEFLGRDFTRTSAETLFQSERVPVAAPAPPVASPAPAAHGTTTFGSVNNYDAEIANVTIQIRSCEDKVFAGTTRPEPYRYVVASYEKTPAFFLLYAVGDKLEMYVVQRSDCYIRLFIPPR